MKWIMYKYPLMWGENQMTVPLGTKFLSVGCQNGQLCAWARVPVTGLDEMVEQTITVVPTGQEWTDHSEPIDSVEFLGTAFVEEHPSGLYPPPGGPVYHAFLTKGGGK